LSVWTPTRRINVQATSGDDRRAWIARHPWIGRLLQGDHNPADLGWLFFEKGLGTKNP
jgi:hypothetical protein